MLSFFFFFYFCHRYTSKFRQEVKKEYDSNKGEYRTMGQAKVPVPTTDNYLKKHSKEPQLPPSKSDLMCSSILMVHLETYYRICHELTVEIKFC